MTLAVDQGQVTGAGQYENNSGVGPFSVAGVQTGDAISLTISTPLGIANYTGQLSEGEQAVTFTKLTGQLTGVLASNAITVDFLKDAPAVTRVNISCHDGCVTYAVAEVKRVALSLDPTDFVCGTHMRPYPVRWIVRDPSILEVAIDYVNCDVGLFEVTGLKPGSTWFLGLSGSGVDSAFMTVQ